MIAMAIGLISAGLWALSMLALLGLIYGRVARIERLLDDEQDGRIWERRHAVKPENKAP